jgi:hypothetical protein
MPGAVDQLKLGSPCVLTKTGRDALKVSKENSAGVVMCKIKTLARYRNADKTPMSEAGTAF